MHVARLRWVEGLQFAATTPSGHALLIDGAREGGGADSAVHPKELLLVGLAGCTAMDVISILGKMKVEVERFEVRVEAEETVEHPHRYPKIKVTYLLSGKDIPEDKLKHAIELSETKYCGAMATLRQGAEISLAYEIDKKP
jgi:putative redox protein